MLNYDENNNNNPDGIFVVNGQIYSAVELINAMRRHGIHVRVSPNGLNIDGEQISSISNLDDNKCPLATTCDKRVALIEFLKLQKKQNMVNYNEKEFQIEPEPIHSLFDETLPLRNEPKNRRESSRRDFIKANNHDLFDGNISSKPGLFDEPISQDGGLFDGPDLFSAHESSQFEDSFYKEQDHYEERKTLQNESISQKRNLDYHEKDQPFCSECGFDLKPNWVSCPNCGYRIIRKNVQNDKNYFY
ncbi:MAG: zinc ribbon domain-containing protein [Candidatus Thorarchaeota archaeon]